MASSGTATFTVNRDELIAASLQKLRVIAAGQTPDAAMVTLLTQKLNFILKSAQSNGLLLWTYQLIAIPMVQGKNTYTLGPAPADVVCNRPLRLFEGSYIRTVCGDQTFDTQLRLISRLEYLQFGGKNTQSVPNSIEFMPMIDTGTPFAGGTTSPSTGHAAVQVYATPEDGTRTIYGNFQRQIFDAGSASSEFDLPAEGFLWLMTQLAAISADDFEVPEERIRRLYQEADMYKQALFDWSVETPSMTLQPDQQVYQRR